MNWRVENENVCYYEKRQLAAWYEMLTYNLLYIAHDWLKARNKYEYFIQNKKTRINVLELVFQLT